MELGFGFASALEPEVVAGALERFKPDVTVRFSAFASLRELRWQILL